MTTFPKLRLGKETLRTLDDRESAQVAGALSGEDCPTIRLTRIETGCFPVTTTIRF